MRARPFAAALCACLLAPAISTCGAAPAAAPAAVAPGGDVVLVTLDTLRADALGFAGNSKSQTPVLDRLAAAGKVFPNAHAHNVVTLPSHANILTGLYPFQHGVRENSGFTLRPEVPTLAAMLAAAGYQTAAFIGAYPLDSQFGLDRGFGVYDDRLPKGSRPTELVLAERRGDQVVAAALGWWKAQAGKKRFLWVHLFDAHAPYAPPEPFASRFPNDPYLGEVAAVDSFLGPLLEPFLAGREAPALVVVTADHGESLGEHGELTHGLFAYEPTLKVPLVLWGRAVAAGRDERPARHVDILPTVLEAAGVPRPQDKDFPLPGRSLLAPPPSGRAADSYFESLSAALNRGWAPLSGLIRDGKKAIDLPLPELYDLPRDPEEATNLAERERPLYGELVAAVPAASGWPPPARQEVSPETAAQLRALGYVSSSAPLEATFGAEDDPKRLIGLDRKIHQVVELYSLGRAKEAVALARELVAERPTMPLGYSFLAQALLEAGDTPGAVEVMNAARAKGVASESVLRQLALSLAELGRAGEGAALLAPLAQAQGTGPGDLETLVTYGQVLSEAGRQPEAASVLERVLARDADHPKTHETLGLIALRLGRLPEARQESERALAANPELSLAWNNLGVALYQLGDVPGALDAWERAVTIDPKLYDALYNLGFKAAEHGRPETARKALERFAATAPAARYAADVAEARRMLARLPKG